MDDKVQQIGRSGIMTGITKYKRITSEVVEICHHAVQLRVPPYIHIVAGK